MILACQRPRETALSQSYEVWFRFPFTAAYASKITRGRVAAYASWPLRRSSTGHLHQRAFPRSKDITDGTPAISASCRAQYPALWACSSPSPAPPPALGFRVVLLGLHLGHFATGGGCLLHSASGRLWALGESQPSMPASTLRLLPHAHGTGRCAVAPL
jgi:hypothetical protein